MEPLLVDNYLNSIIKIVKVYPQALLIAPNGSGVHLGVPAALASSEKKYRIMVSVPNDDAALALYTHALTRYPDINFGYAITNNIKYDKDTRVVYAVPVHISEMILNSKRDWKDHSDTKYQVLMLPNFHHLSAEDYLIFSLWQRTFKKILSKKINNISFPHLVTVSPIPVSVSKSMAQAKIPITHNKIMLNYSNKNYSPYSNDLVNDAAITAVNAIKSSAKGHVLVYVPSQKIIYKITSSIRKFIKSYDNINIFIHDKNTTSLEYEQLHNMDTKDKYIIITTDQITSSLTTSFISTIIDLVSTQRISNYEKLLVNNSKRVSNIRMHRTGWVDSSTVVRMITKESFDYLPDTNINEITNTNIDIILLRLLEHRIIISDVFIDMDTVPKDKINNSIIRLKSLNCIDNRNMLTDIGKFILSVSKTLAPKDDIDIHNKVLIYHYNNSGNNIYIGILIASLIHSYGTSYFYTPRYDQKKYNSPHQYNMAMTDHMRNNLMSFLGKSEIETSLKIWQNMLLSQNTSINDPNIKKYIVNFSNRYSMNNKQLQLAVHTVKVLVQSISSTLNTSIQEKNDFYIVDALNILRPIAKLSYPLSIMKKIDSRSPNPKYESVDGNIYSTTFNTPLNRYLFDKPTEIVAFKINVIDKNYLDSTILMGIDIDTEVQEKYNIIKPIQLYRRYDTNPRYDKYGMISNELPELNTNQVLYGSHTLRDENFTATIDIQNLQLIEPL